MFLAQMLILLFMLSGLHTSYVHAEAGTPKESGQAYNLQDILALVLERNPSMTESQGVIDQKAGGQISAFAYPNPTLTLQSGRGKVRDPSGITLTERYVTLSQPLEWPGTRTARQQAAQAGLASARASGDEQTLNLIAVTKQAFYSLLLAERQKEMDRQNVLTMQEVREAVILRVDAGEAPPFEAVKVKVEAMKAQKEFARAKGTIRTLQASLNNLTAGALAPNFTIQGHFATMPGELPTKLSEQDLDRHPTIMKWQKLVEEAHQAHRREQQARIPDVTISGSYQRDAGREAYVGILSIPFPVWNQRQGEIAQAKGALRQQEAHLLRAKYELLKGVTQQIQISKTAAAQMTMYEQGLLKQAKEALRIAQVSFKFGEASLLDLLDAQRVLRQTFQGYAQARFDLAIALTELEQLVGKEL